jgi:hypothetical protein
VNLERAHQLTFGRKGARNEYTPYAQSMHNLCTVVFGALLVGGLFAASYRALGVSDLRAVVDAIRGVEPLARFET